jgi:hypothetical protein
MKYLRESPLWDQIANGSLDFRITFYTGPVQGISCVRGYHALLQKKVGSARFARILRNERAAISTTH